VILGAVLALGACSSAERAAIPAPPAPPGTSSSSTTASRPSSTTTTSTPEFSFDDSVPPPKLVNTGTNYVAILKSLNAYLVWTAAHHPDPALVDQFAAGGTNLSKSYVDTLMTLRKKSQRFVERLDGPDQYTIISHTADAFSATIVQRITAHDVVSRSGDVVRSARFRGQTKYLALAARTAGHWYLASQDVTVAPERVS
jgi:hypothetical protein